MPRMVRQASVRSGRRAGLIPIVIVILSLLATLVVLTQANPLTTRLGRDSGMYAYVASHLLDGKTPYVTAWEHKPPMIFFIDAAGLWMGGGTRWGIWAMEFLFLLGASLAGFHALRRNFGTAPAVFGSLIWLSGLSLVLEGGNFTEEYSLLFSFVSLLLFGMLLQRPASLWIHALLGLAFGCSFMTRPNNAGVQVAIVLVEVLLVALKQRPLGQTLRGLIAAGIGFLVPVIAAAAYFASRNAFQAMLDAGFIYNLSYGGQVNFAGAFVSGILNLGFAAGVALVGMGVAFNNLLTKFRSRTVEPLMLWLGIDFVIEVALSGLSGLNYPHYFMSWLPWMAVASSLLFRRVFLEFADWIQKTPAAALLALMLIVVLASLNSLAVYAGAFSRLVTSGAAMQRAELLPRYVSDRTSPADTVLVWGGEAGINYLSGRDSPTAHFQYGILVRSPITDRISAQFYQDIVSHPPALILDGSMGDNSGDLVPLSTANPVAWCAARKVYAPPYLQQFFDFVHQNYTYRSTVAGVPVYSLNR
jgi:hypothetical protein